MFKKTKEETLKFPQLPNGMKPTAVYVRADKWVKGTTYFVAVVITEHAVIEFTWDGVAATFLTEKAFVRHFSEN